MKYELTYTRRGDVTDDQKEDFLKKLKLTIVKAKEKGRNGLWLVRGPNGLTDDDVTKALKKIKISKEMSNAKIAAV